MADSPACDVRAFLRAGQECKRCVGLLCSKCNAIQAAYGVGWLCRWFATANSGAARQQSTGERCPGRCKGLRPI